MPLSFAVATSDSLLHTAITSFSNNVEQSNSAVYATAADEQEPMSLEQGIAALTSCCGLYVVEADIAGNGSAIAILSDGTLWTWGHGGGGRLGHGDTVNRYVPTQVGTNTNWSSISGGVSGKAAIQSDGTLWTWGLNNDGRLGHGDTVNRYVPTQVGTNTDWSSVTGNGSFAIRTDGTLWSWGGGAPGEINASIISLEPIQIQPGTTWSSVARGSQHILAIRTDGSLWAWGDRARVSVAGTGSGAVLEPIQVQPGTTWSSVAAGNFNSGGIRTDGTLWTWGVLAGGIQQSVPALGLGTTGGRTMPTQVGTDTSWASISASNSHKLATRTDGTLWAWGTNVNGILGLGDTVSRYVPTQVGTDTSWASVLSGGMHQCSMAIRTDGTLWTWGNGASGRLGLGSAAQQSTPQLVMPLPSLTVTSVTPVGFYNVPINSQLAITFSHPARSTNVAGNWGGPGANEVGTPTVTLNGTTLTGGVWSAGNTVLTFNLAGLLAEDVTYHVVVDGYRAQRFFAYGLGAYMCDPHTHSFRTGPPEPDPEVPLTKTLQVAEDTTLPTSLSFTFNFTSVSGSPAIADETITLHATDANAPDAGIVTVVDDLDLWALIDGLNLPAGSSYSWEVREEVNSSNVTVASTPRSSMEYDTTTMYRLTAFVDGSGNLVSLEILRFVYTDGTYVLDTTGTDSYGKREYMSFTNTYRRVVGGTGTADPNAFELTKMIPATENNRFADESTAFSFTLALTEPALNPIGTLQARIVTINAVGSVAAGTQVGTQNIVAGTNTFTLLHNQRLIIDVLPVGTRFAVTEAPHIAFAPSATAVLGGTATAASPYTEDKNTALPVPVTGTYMILETGRNAVDFENNTTAILPTGISVSNAPAVLPVIAIAGIVLLLVSKHRKRIEELPVV